MYKMTILFSLFVSSMFCQSLKVGGNTVVGIKNKNLQYNIGAQFLIFYQLNENFDIGANYSASLSQLEGLDDYSGVLSRFGLSLFYYPFNIAVRPYFGLGISYNLNTLLFSDGIHPYGAARLHNSIGYETGIGIIQKMKKNLELNIGFQFSYQNMSYSFNSDNDKVIKSSESKYEISSLSMYLGLIFLL